MDKSSMKVELRISLRGIVTGKLACFVVLKRLRNSEWVEEDRCRSEISPDGSVDPNFYFPFRLRYVPSKHQGMRFEVYLCPAGELHASSPLIGGPSNPGPNYPLTAVHPPPSSTFTGLLEHCTLYGFWNGEMRDVMGQPNFALTEFLTVYGDHSPTDHNGLLARRSPPGCILIRAVPRVRAWSAAGSLQLRCGLLDPEKNTLATTRSRNRSHPYLVFLRPPPLPPGAEPEDYAGELEEVPVWETEPLRAGHGGVYDAVELPLDWLGHGDHATPVKVWLMEWSDPQEGTGASVLGEAYTTVGELLQLGVEAAGVDSGRKSDPSAYPKIALTRSDRNKAKIVGQLAIFRCSHTRVKDIEEQLQLVGKIPPPMPPTPPTPKPLAEGGSEDASAGGAKLRMRRPSFKQRALSKVSSRRGSLFDASPSAETGSSSTGGGIGSWIKGLVKDKDSSAAASAAASDKGMENFSVSYPMVVKGGKEGEAPSVPLEVVERGHASPVFGSTNDTGATLSSSAGSSAHATLGQGTSATVDSTATAGTTVVDGTVGSHETSAHSANASTPSTSSDNRAQVGQPLSSSHSAELQSDASVPAPNATNSDRASSHSTDSALPPAAVDVSALPVRFLTLQEMVPGMPPAPGKPHASAADAAPGTAAAGFGMSIGTDPAALHTTSPPGSRRNSDNTAEYSGTPLQPVGPRLTLFPSQLEATPAAQKASLPPKLDAPVTLAVVWSGSSANSPSATHVDVDSSDFSGAIGSASSASMPLDTAIKSSLAKTPSRSPSRTRSRVHFDTDDIPRNSDEDHPSKSNANDSVAAASIASPAPAPISAAAPANKQRPMTPPFQPVDAPVTATPPLPARPAPAPNSAAAAPTANRAQSTQDASPVAAAPTTKAPANSTTSAATVATSASLASPTPTSSLATRYLDHRRAVSGTAPLTALSPSTTANANASNPSGTALLSSMKPRRALFPSVPLPNGLELTAAGTGSAGAAPFRALSVPKKITLVRDLSETGVSDANLNGSARLVPGDGMGARSVLAQLHSEAVHSWLEKRADFAQLKAGNPEWFSNVGHYYSLRQRAEDDAAASGGGTASIPVTAGGNFASQTHTALDPNAEMTEADLVAPDFVAQDWFRAVSKLQHVAGTLSSDIGPLLEPTKHTPSTVLAPIASPLDRPGTSLSSFLAVSGDAGDGGVLSPSMQADMDADFPLLVYESGVAASSDLGALQGAGAGVASSEEYANWRQRVSELVGVPTASSAALKTDMDDANDKDVEGGRDRDKEEKRGRRGTKSKGDRAKSRGASKTPEPRSPSLPAPKTPIVGENSRPTSPSPTKRRRSKRAKTPRSKTSTAFTTEASPAASAQLLPFLSRLPVGAPPALRKSLARAWFFFASAFPAEYFGAGAKCIEKHLPPPLQGGILPLCLVPLSKAFQEDFALFPTLLLASVFASYPTTFSIFWDLRSKILHALRQDLAILRTSLSVALKELHAVVTDIQGGVPKLQFPAVTYNRFGESNVSSSALMSPSALRNGKIVEFLPLHQVFSFAQKARQLLMQVQEGKIDQDNSAPSASISGGKSSETTGNQEEEVSVSDLLALTKSVREVDLRLLFSIALPDLTQALFPTAVGNAVTDAPVVPVTGPDLHLSLPAALAGLLPVLKPNESPIPALFAAGTENALRSHLAAVAEREEIECVRDKKQKVLASVQALADSTYTQLEATRSQVRDSLANQYERLCVALHGLQQVTGETFTPPPSNIEPWMDKLQAATAAAIEAGPRGRNEDGNERDEDATIPAVVDGSSLVADANASPAATVLSPNTDALPAFLPPSLVGVVPEEESKEERLRRAIQSAEEEAIERIRKEFTAKQEALRAETEKRLQDIQQEGDNSVAQLEKKIEMVPAEIQRFLDETVTNSVAPAEEASNIPTESKKFGGTVAPPLCFPKGATTPFANTGYTLDDIVACAPPATAGPASVAFRVAHAAVKNVSSDVGKLRKEQQELYDQVQLRRTRTAALQRILATCIDVYDLKISTRRLWSQRQIPLQTLRPFLIDLFLLAPYSHAVDLRIRQTFSAAMENKPHPLPPPPLEVQTWSEARVALAGNLYPLLTQQEHRAQYWKPEFVAPHSGALAALSDPTASLPTGVHEEVLGGTADRGRTTNDHTVPPQSPGVLASLAWTSLRRTDTPANTDPVLASPTTVGPLSASLSATGADTGTFSGTGIYFPMPGRLDIPPLQTQSLPVFTGGIDYFPSFWKGSDGDELESEYKYNPAKYWDLFQVAQQLRRNPLMLTTGAFGGDAQKNHAFRYSLGGGVYSGDMSAAASWPGVPATYTLPRSSSKGATAGAAYDSDDSEDDSWGNVSTIKRMVLMQGSLRRSQVHTLNSQGLAAESMADANTSALHLSSDHHHGVTVVRDVPPSAPRYLPSMDTTYLTSPTRPSLYNEMVPQVPKTAVPGLNPYAIAPPPPPQQASGASQLQPKEVQSDTIQAAAATAHAAAQDPPQTAFEPEDLRSRFEELLASPTTHNGQAHSAPGSGEEHFPLRTLSRRAGPSVRPLPTPRKRQAGSNGPSANATANNDASAVGRSDINTGAAGANPPPSEKLLRRRQQEQLLIQTEQQVLELLRASPPSASSQSRLSADPPSIPSTTTEGFALSPVPHASLDSSAATATDIPNSGIEPRPKNLPPPPTVDPIADLSRYYFDAAILTPPNKKKQGAVRPPQTPPLPPNRQNLSSHLYGYAYTPSKEVPSPATPKEQPPTTPQLQHQLQSRLKVQAQAPIHIQTSPIAQKRYSSLQLDAKARQQLQAYVHSSLESDRPVTVLPMWEEQARHPSPEPLGVQITRNDLGKLLSQ